MHIMLNWHVQYINRHAVIHFYGLNFSTNIDYYHFFYLKKKIYS